MLSLFFSFEHDIYANEAAKKKIANLKDIISIPPFLEI